MGDRIRNIVVIGAGNVAYHLVRVFLENRLGVAQVVARTEASAKRFSRAYPGLFVSTAPALLAEADMYILAVNDDRIPEAADAMDIKGQLVVHTSGTVPLEELEDISSNTGVFYPLQTLSFGTDIDFSAVPICIEANTKKNLEKLDELARRLSGKVYSVDSTRRKTLHLAAVFASNFGFHMFDMAKSLLAERHIDPGILSPLIMETARKATLSQPRSGQTGPASRNDLEVIRQHLDMLKDQAQYGDLYKMITESIISHKKGPENEL